MSSEQTLYSRIHAIHGACRHHGL